MENLDDLRVQMSQQRERLDAIEQHLNQREAALLDEATVHAMLVWMLDKKRTRMTDADVNAIRFARQRVQDGQSLRPQLDRLLDDIQKEIALRTRKSAQT